MVERTGSGFPGSSLCAKCGKSAINLLIKISARKRISAFPNMSNYPFNHTNKASHSKSNKKILVVNSRKIFFSVDIMSNA